MAPSDSLNGSLPQEPCCSVPVRRQGTHRSTVPPHLSYVFISFPVAVAGCSDKGNLKEKQLTFKGTYSPS